MDNFNCLSCCGGCGGMVLLLFWCVVLAAVLETSL